MSDPSRTRLVLGALLSLALFTRCPFPSAAPCGAGEQACPAGSFCDSERGYCVVSSDGSLPAGLDASADAAVVTTDAAGQDRQGSDLEPADTRVDAAAALDAGPLDTPAADTALLDARVPDDATADASRPDSSLDDAVGADSAIADTAIADSAVPDTAIDDAATPDTALDDAATPDTAIDDSATPDTAIDDAAIPDTAIADSATPDTAIDDAAQPDAGSPAVVEEHHAGTTTLGAADDVATITLAAPVAPDRSILFFNTTTNSADPVNGHVAGQLINNGTQVRFERGNSATGIIAELSWSVVQLDGIRVLRGTETASSGTTRTVANLGQAVNLDRSFPLFSFHLGGGTYNSNDWRHAYFADDQTLHFDRDNGNDPGAIDWQVVEFLSTSSGRVRSGTLSMPSSNGSSTTVGLDPVVDPTRSFLLFSYELGGSGGMNNQLVRGDIASANQLSFERYTDGISVAGTWFLVEWDAMAVQRGSVLIQDGELGSSGSLNPDVDTARSVSFCPSYQRQGMANNTVDRIGTGWATTQVNGAGTTLDVRRGYSTGAAQVHWNVVEFQ